MLYMPILNCNKYIIPVNREPVLRSLCFYLNVNETLLIDCELLLRHYNLSLRRCYLSLRYDEMSLRRSHMTLWHSEMSLRYDELSLRRCNL